MKLRDRLERPLQYLLQSHCPLGPGTRNTAVKIFRETLQMAEMQMPDTREMEAALKNDTAGFARLFLLRGLHFERNGDIIRAIEDYDTALRINPENAEIFCIRGLALCRKGALDQAIANFDDALRIDPAFEKALFARGNAWETKRRFDRAIQDYDAVLRLNPHNLQATSSRENILGQKISAMS